MTDIPNTQTEQQAEPLFFNVMPRARVKSSLVLNMTAGPQTSAGTGAKFSLPQRFSSKTLVSIFLIVIFAAALGVGGYFAYKWRQKKQSADASILIPEALRPPRAVTPPPPDSSGNPPPSGLLFTTPPTWQKRHFGSETCTSSICIDSADPDNDGLDNVSEEATQTDPKDNDTDNDGLADGDEGIFGSSPVTGRTAGDLKYTDPDYLRGGYDPRTKDLRMSVDRLTEIRSLITKRGLHEPTITTLGAALANFKDGVGASIDNSATAQLDRDAQRLATIKKIGVALYAFKEDAGYYPVTSSFAEMVDKIKPYNSVATNFKDPIHTPPYVYTYEAISNGSDFVVTYYSETQRQAIRYTGANATRDAGLEGANTRDGKRVQDLESIRSALLIYSAANSGKDKSAVFPKTDAFTEALVPKFLDVMPRDPQTNKEYEYTVSESLDSFTVKVKLENPPAGSTGYLCLPEECDTY